MSLKRLDNDYNHLFVLDFPKNQYINNEFKKGSNQFYVYLNFRKNAIHKKDNRIIEMKLI